MERCYLHSTYRKKIDTNMRKYLYIFNIIFCVLIIAITGCKPNSSYHSSYIKPHTLIVFKAITPFYTNNLSLVLIDNSSPHDSLGFYIQNQWNVLSLSGKWELFNDTLLLSPRAYIGINYKANEWTCNDEVDKDSYDGIPQKFILRNE